MDEVWELYKWKQHRLIHHNKTNWPAEIWSSNSVKHDSAAFIQNIIYLTLTESLTKESKSESLPAHTDMLLNRTQQVLLKVKGIVYYVIVITNILPVSDGFLKQP